MGFGTTTFCPCQIGADIEPSYKFLKWGRIMKNENTTITIQLADLNSPLFIELVNRHKALMLEHSPPESSHALLIDGLRSPDITVWSLFDSDVLIGCGALKMLSPVHGEIKGMHTVSERRKEGLGKIMLAHIIREARKRSIRRLSLETGAQKGFLPARKFYESYGFKYCGPFDSYKEDPNSVFMFMELAVETNLREENALP